ncbi:MULTISPECIES: carbohydrate ABC transporter permease [Sphaerochaeta]|jgi:oligogalacturonide transport system permease protein|uniref:L-arabinose transport system permease protein AraQ n=2 Tax=root TaxID=1 RepID=A0A644X9I2_9ZZZZ|nr:MULTISPECIES: carbohydrate ABC transporter permease [Sphaerochaeta]MDT3357833.1 carbohydrate ABC transporter permease [Spirochaetota bacterium]MDD3457075.1 carbohydrate ABC transporter permease [Sphaerochaeta sp.]MDD4038482.1 carbohydrate ABC transporter permease [Sphaerochaeta sp.]MDX9985355.1 carbohydrate ABC transporter permease [Sphaerochaeta sp.]MEA5029798.1 carbohydrate ABC transporter permease [Sphaerochaeta associata]
MIKRKTPLSRFLSYFFLIALAYIMTYPLLWMIGAAFKSNEEIFGTIGLLPKNPMFGAFAAGWKGTGQYGFSTFLYNTFLMVIPTVLFTAISATLIGYGFARFEFPFKKTLFTIMLSTMMLPATVILIPRYIFFRNLGWLDSYLPFIVPAMLGCFPFFNFMMVQFFRGLPLELDESGKLDGCNSFIILKDLLLPLCKSAIFSVIVFQFVWTWNDFLNVLIYISSVAKYPVALGLRMTMDISTEFDWNQILAMSLISIAPPIVLFFAAQKYFVEGIATTGMKN